MIFVDILRYRLPVSHKDDVTQIVNTRMYGADVRRHGSKRCGVGAAVCERNEVTVTNTVDKAVDTGGAGIDIIFAVGNRNDISMISRDMHSLGKFKCFPTFSTGCNCPIVRTCNQTIVIQIP